MNWRPRWPWSRPDRPRHGGAGEAAKARRGAEQRLRETHRRTPEIRRVANAFAAQVEAAMANRGRP